MAKIQHKVLSQNDTDAGKGIHVQLSIPDFADEAARLAYVQSASERGGHAWQLSDGTTWQADGAGGWKRMDDTAGGGEANTSSNAGAGAGLAKAKSGVDLPFKSLVAGANVTLTPSADEISIAAAGAATALQQAYEAGRIITVDIPGEGTFLVQNTAADAGTVMKLVQASGAGLGGNLLELELGAAQTAGIAAFIHDLSDYTNVINTAIALRVRAGSPLQNALRVGTTFEIDAAGSGVQVSLDSQATLLLYSDIAIRLGRTGAAGGAYKVPLLAVGQEFTLPAAKGAAGTVVTDVAGDGVLSMQPAAGGGGRSGAGTGQTLGAVTDVLASIGTVENDTAISAHVRTIGQDDTSNEMLVYVDEIMIKRNGAGTVTVEQVSAVVTALENFTPPSRGVKYIVNGNNIDVQAQGTAAHDVQWSTEWAALDLSLGGG